VAAVNTSARQRFEGHAETGLGVQIGVQNQASDIVTSSKFEGGAEGGIRFV
jgi:hypothetical protein